MNITVKHLISHIRAQDVRLYEALDNLANVINQTVLVQDVFQSGVLSLARNWGLEDTGKVIWVTDYNHLLRWVGTEFTWAAGELGSDFYLLFDAVPTSVKWHLADGATGVKYLKPDGTIATKTISTIADTYYRQ